mmetsp:Transcript_2136/g.3458  ORF Transcript_2136/g.3458 Transcript_2136/m.3458 type:complete len:172 (+) Transcript_2136:554-1069(+)
MRRCILIMMLLLLLLLVMSICVADDGFPGILQFLLFVFILFALSIRIIVQPLHDIVAHGLEFLLLHCVDIERALLIIQSVSDLIRHVFQLVFGLNGFPFLFVLGLELFRVSDDFVELVLRESGSSARLDGDALFARLVFGVFRLDGQHAVGIHIEAHLDLRHSSGSRRDAH